MVFFDVCLLLFFQLINPAVEMRREIPDFERQLFIYCSIRLMVNYAIKLVDN